MIRVVRVWILGVAKDREGECYEIVNIVYVQRLQQSEKAS